jgi:outer membrane protein assembly factor BamE
MTRRFGFVVLSAAALVLGGCSMRGWLESTLLPFFHRIDVQQGNVVTQDMLARLEHGMDRAKVRSIMGTSLVKDAFNQDRWDYVYTMKPAGEDRVERRVTLYFQEERLVRVAGDVKPASGHLEPQPRPEITVEVPGERERGWLTAIADAIGLGDDEVEKGQDAGPAAPGVELANTGVQAGRIPEEDADLPR